MATDMHDETSSLVPAEERALLPKTSSECASTKAYYKQAIRKNPFVDSSSDGSRSFSSCGEHEKVSSLTSTSSGKWARGKTKWWPRASSASRDMLVASWLFLVGSAVFTLCVAGELAVDLRSLPFWMLTSSGVLFCAGSAAFIRAFSGDRDASAVLFAIDEDEDEARSAHVDDEVETAGCSGCRACLGRHLATDLLIASWLFLAACFPVVVASACYVFHHDDRLYFWGVLAGSLAFTIASGFFVIASYPDHLASELEKRTSVSTALSEYGGIDERHADRHCGSEWLVSNWLFLVLTAGWLLASAYLVIRQPSETDFRFSFVEALIYFFASIYFVKGSYKAQAEAQAALAKYSDHRHPPMSDQADDITRSYFI